MASGRRVGQRPDCQTFLCKFWHFQMAVSQWKLAWLTPNLGILWISVSYLWLCQSIVANPIIYRLVPRPSRFETRQFKSCLWCCDIVVVANWSCQDWFISPIFRFLNKDYLFINWNKLRNRPCMSSCNCTINLFCLLSRFPFWTSDMFRVRFNTCVKMTITNWKFPNIVSKTSLALLSSISS